LEETGTLIGAGHETTGNTVCFSFYLLALHKEKQQKLREEVDLFFKSHNQGSITYDDIKELNYCVAVFYETLRLYPTVYLFLCAL
jgi:cytochrome P450